jgi:enoyl-CoA hydratase
MKWTSLLTEARDGILTLTVNRPRELNALNAETMRELDAVFVEIESDETVRGVIVTGAGDRAFVAGADIKELALETATSGRESSLRGQRVMRRIEQCGKPVVAAINGFALGGGLELALACHIRVAAEGARMGLPEVKLGVIPGYGGTQRLARLVGKGRALELILTGGMIDAAEAHRIGLVNRVVESGALLPTAGSLIGEIVANGPLATRYATLAVATGLDSGLEVGLALETSLFGLLCATDDMKEGMKAFLEKRSPRFGGK